MISKLGKWIAGNTIAFSLLIGLGTAFLAWDSSRIEAYQKAAKLEVARDANNDAQQRSDAAEKAGNKARKATPAADAPDAASRVRELCKRDQSCRGGGR